MDPALLTPDLLAPGDGSATGAVTIPAGRLPQKRVSPFARRAIEACRPAAIAATPASPGLLLFSLVFSTALGMSGGLYPAYWAVRMSPMEAIRRG